MSKRIEYIQQNSIGTNYTTLFLLPTLGFTKSFFGDNFISCYIIDVLRPKLALVFKNEEDTELKEIMFLLQSHDEYVDSHFDDDNREVIVVMNFPKEFKDDFLTFKKGRYREFSHDLKEVLLDVHGRVTGNGKCIYMVDALYPDNAAKKYKADQLGVTPDDLPNGEVMSIPDMDKELYLRIEELDEMGDKIRTKKNR